MFDVVSKKDKIKELEDNMRAPEFWSDRENAEKVSGKLARLKEEIQSTDEILKEIAELEEFASYAETDQQIAKELNERINALGRTISKEELATFFSGPYDKNNAVITIYSGAGGQDAQDWAGMLLRMYERYTASRGYKTRLLSQSFGEDRGIKEATLEVEGRYVYGYLKNENGVHRLVRISPYSAQKLRHTSFALVEVLPQLPKQSEAELDIRPEDLEVQTFRSSGPGGQYVNKTESAVRIKHLPTGVVVECQSERLQGQNKEGAMKLLISKLFAKYAKDKKEKLMKIRGGFVPAEWGHQIRSYVLHPYKMVKDHRSEVETSDVEKVLDGDLEEFIKAEVKMQ
ncbi:MAG: peptide chain release factor 2 [Candidatus Spechtbacterales bacterium]